MLIAVRRAQQSMFFRSIEDVISVFDSDDITVENVRIKDMLESGVDVVNFSINGLRIGNSDILDISKNFGLFNVYVSDSSFSFIVKGIHVSVLKLSSTLYLLNGIKFPQEYFYPHKLHYFFLFRGNLILRFNGQSDTMFSIAVGSDNSVVAYWNFDYNIVYNLSFAQQVDLISEV